MANLSILVVVFVFAALMQVACGQWESNFDNQNVASFASARGPLSAPFPYKTLIPGFKKREEEGHRYCGVRIIHAAREICENGCIGFRPMKRSGGTVTDRCCKNKCTHSWIKENLCCK
ncbi:hypothetical protein L596_010567 [Steinernema carpocapsae]|uniref:Uncharacterized protein n=1 Tax=Steinernema carpocapsae TaxID=34508 RepID=A0A4U5PJC3_STECR|nr:hypothetical protein L596_010567 [Steinernema carpocapsae]